MLGTKRETFFFHNTLVCLVKALQNKQITMDLRNDTYVCGTVDNVDGFMNVTLKHVVYCDPQGNEYIFDDLFVLARNIRYVHIPESMSILPTIKQELNKPKLKKRNDNKKDIEKSRKRQKALKQHLETVANL